jgi:phosphoglucomutase
MGDKKVVTIEDYKAGTRFNAEAKTTEEITLPSSNVLKYYLEDGSWFCLRPSGTEPKAKFYFGVKGETLADSEQKLEALTSALMKKVNELI